MKELISWALLCFGVGFANAQTVHLQIEGNDSSLHAMKIYIRSLSEAGDTAVLLQKAGRRFTGNIPLSFTGVFQGFAADRQRQYSFPLYISGSQSHLINYALKNNCPYIDGDTNNRALSAFNAIVYQRSKDFWLQGARWDSDHLTAFLKGYKSAVDSLLAQTSCVTNVKNYLRLWAYSETCNAYSSLKQVTGKGTTDVPFRIEDVWPDVDKLLDSPATLYFPVLVQSITDSVEGTDLPSRLKFLQSRYTCKAVLHKVQSLLVEHFISSFNYSRGYEQGLLMLKKATVDYQLDRKYVEAFKMRRATVKGVPFPSGISLTDKTGVRRDFSSFKGFYVYIDLWASWCVPCCKEVPYLQKLEKEVQNKQVKFLSVSLDKDENAWKNRMKALDMDGNQWLDKDGKLPEALNVKGIPFFLIYDKDGKLLRYNAPRPSDPALKDLLESLE